MWSIAGQVNRHVGLVVGKYQVRAKREGRLGGLAVGEEELHLVALAIGQPETIQLDGLRCTGGNVLRHGARGTNANGDNVNPWSVVAGTFNSGETRYFSVIYREFDTLVCQTGQNTSNGVAVLFGP